jgi:hypothetical protein
LNGSYDPQLRLIYWGTGNPNPDYDGAVRPGDNLYTDCVVALDAETGKLRWHYQFTPHDVWDFDGVNEMVLVDLHIDTQIVKGLVHADRNGHFYALDRNNQIHRVPPGVVVARLTRITERRLDGGPDRGIPIERSQGAAAPRLPPKKPPGVEVLAPSRRAQRGCRELPRNRSSSCHGAEKVSASHGRSR